MRSVGDSARNPANVFSATAQSTACTSTKMTLLSPRPNQINASGSRAIDGSGLNIAVNVSSRSAPMRDTLANAVSNAAKNKPGHIALQQQRQCVETGGRNLACGDTGQ